MARLPTLAKTAARMRVWFAGKHDKAGAPYYEHCERVLARLLARHPEASVEAQHAALLHDVLEDTKISGLDLWDMGYSGKALDYVKHLSRLEINSFKPPYLDWIRELAAGAPQEVLWIKLADNEDNLAPERLAQLSSEQRAWAVERYWPAKALLLLALQSRFGEAVTL